MKFNRYNSIENTQRQKAIDDIVIYGNNEGVWVVTEKIHGSNFSLSVGKDEIKATKRSSFIEDPIKFFRSDTVIEAYEERAKVLRGLVLRDFNLDDDDVDNVQIYGEIYGGRYPHDDVDRVQNAKTVQHGVFYCPHNDFYPFDIYVRLGDRSFPVDHDIFEKLMDEAGFKFYAKALFTGTFKECLEYKNEYQTTLPALYGLPEIDDNICEGNVLKPMKAKRTPAGSRIILKNKNDRFKEKEHTKKVKVPRETPIEVTLAVQEIAPYITENRLRNVISHIGTIDQKQFGMLLKAFSEDVRTDFEKDHEGLLDKLTRDHLGRVNKVVNTTAAIMIKNNFANIIDGNF